MLKLSVLLFDHANQQVLVYVIVYAVYNMGIAILFYHKS